MIPRPALWRTTLRLHWHALPGRPGLAASGLAFPLLDILPMLERLGEVADMADHVLISVEGERYYRLRACLVVGSSNTIQVEKEIRGLNVQ